MLHRSPIPPPRRPAGGQSIDEAAATEKEHNYDHPNGQVGVNRQKIRSG